MMAWTACSAISVASWRTDREYGQERRARGGYPARHVRGPDRACHVAADALGQRLEEYVAAVDRRHGGKRTVRRWVPLARWSGTGDERSARVAFPPVPAASVNYAGGAGPVVNGDAPEHGPDGLRDHNEAVFARRQDGFASRGGGPPWLTAS